MKAGTNIISLLFILICAKIAIVIKMEMVAVSMIIMCIFFVSGSQNNKPAVTKTAGLLHLLNRGKYKYIPWSKTGISCLFIIFNVV